EGSHADQRPDAHHADVRYRGHTQPGNDRGDRQRQVDGEQPAGVENPIATADWRTLSGTARNPSTTLGTSPASA
ncbi:hypothetical protein, partial [Rhodococcus gordoniae]